MGVIESGGLRGCRGGNLIAKPKKNACRICGFFGFFRIFATLRFHLTLGRSCGCLFSLKSATNKHIIYKNIFLMATPPSHRTLYNYLSGSRV